MRLRTAMKFVGCLALAGPFAPTAGAEATDADIQPDVWLTAMNRAFVELDYDGLFTFFTGTDLATLRVVHRVEDGVQRERLVHLNGAPREIVRHGEEVACILLPGDELLELEDSIPSGPFARGFVRRFDNLSEHYGLSYFGDDRIANRATVRIAVTPKDNDRYGYRLWLDKEHKLLLRSELIDETGARLEIFQFASIKFADAVDPSALEPVSRSGSLVSHLTLAGDAPAAVPASGEPQWRAQWLPSGFRMAVADIRRKPSNLQAVQTMMYSDGLAAFSIFIEDMPKSGAASMVSRNGATVAVTQAAAGADERRHLVTVVGELPTPTARRIAESVVYRSGP